MNIIIWDKEHAFVWYSLVNKPWKCLLWPNAMTHLYVTGLILLMLMCSFLSSIFPFLTLKRRRIWSNNQIWPRCSKVNIICNLDNTETNLRMYKVKIFQKCSKNKEDKKQSFLDAFIQKMLALSNWRLQNPAMTGPWPCSVKHLRDQFAIVYRIDSWHIYSWDWFFSWSFWLLYVGHHDPVVFQLSRLGANSVPRWECPAHLVICQYGCQRLPIHYCFSQSPVWW